MNYSEFVSEVRQRASLDTNEEAKRAIEATLSTLGERITSDEAEHLAAQLPFEAGRHLTEQETKKDFGLRGFYNHVSQRESIGFPMAQEHARAVMSVVSQLVTPGEMEDVIAQLPDEYLPLFTFGSEGDEWRKI